MQKIKKPRGYISWFIHNHVAANILMLLFIVGGLMSAVTMRTETFPTIDPRLITVTVPYPGATPYEVAESITNRVEEGLVGLDGVKRITATASEGVGVVQVELYDFTNADDVLSDVETAVDSLIDFPPDNAERPRVVKVRVTPQVMTLALYGNASEHALKYWAEQIEDEIRALPGVSLTQIHGIRDYQISIEISQSILKKYNLSLEDVGQAIRAFSEDIPAGTIEASQGDILLRIQEKNYTGDEFAQIPLKTLSNGAVLRLGQVAQIIDGFEDNNLISKFNGYNAAFIDVRRSLSDDTLNVARIVNNYIANVQLPDGLYLTLQRDRTENLKDRMSLMLRNGILGFTLVFLILVLFLDLRLAFWISSAIPISFLGGLMIINALGYSMNMITLFALIVVLGIVVDDGIIIGESIFNSQDTNEDDPTLAGVTAVMSPVLVGVCTTMAAFAPLIFSTGVFGQIIQIIPIVVISILFISLIEAFFIMPAHLTGTHRWSRGILKDLRNRVDNFVSWFIENKLLPFARLIFKWRYATVAAFFGFAFITFSIVSTGHLRFIFFPKVEGDEITINITMPVGTPFETTRRTIEKMNNEIETVREMIDENAKLSAFVSVLTTIGATDGADSPVSSTSGANSSNLGQIKIRLVPSDLRSLSASQIEHKIRRRVEKIPNIESLKFQSSPIGDQADIEIELSHPDESTLGRAAEMLKSQLRSIEGTTEVSDSFEYGKTEYIFELTDQGLAVGLTPLELGRELRSAFFGYEATRVQRGRSEVIVYVRYPKDERVAISSLEKVRIYLADGRAVPLLSVAKVKVSQGFARIQTVDGNRIVSVTADVDPSVSTPNAVMEVLQDRVFERFSAEFPGLKFSFEGKSREQREDLASLARNMCIALMFIFVLLGSQLQSYVQPFVIMAAIPFGVVGAIWGHILLGYDLTFISLFGIVALMGVVVNDSVVLIDHLNKHHRSGTPIVHSAQKAIARRFRPIMLTTLSTSLGLLPIMTETSLQARFLIPMVISLSTGILFATLITLFLVPSLVIIIEDLKQTELKKVIGASKQTCAKAFEYGNGLFKQLKWRKG